MSVGNRVAPGPGPGPGHCLVACDTPGGPVLAAVPLPLGGASIATVLAEARRQPALAGLDVDWEQAPTGIWGQQRPRDAVVAAGDRVELYRRLPRDPRSARRARVASLRRPGR